MILLRKGDSGSYVYMIQLALRRAGFNPGRLDGVFGEQTRRAVQNFQSANRLQTDGIVGRNTFAALRPYLTGYTFYTVRSGDTLSKIASVRGSTVALIENANPNIESTNLEIGLRLVVPFNFNVVPTNITYNALLTELICEGLTVRYPFITLFSAGRSISGKNLPVLKLGKGSKKLFFNASHHANEWITTPLVLNYVEQFAVNVVDAGMMDGDYSEYSYDRVTLYVMPLVNPDGVDLVTGAWEENSNEYKQALQLSGNYPSIPFPSGWKANIRGVDLNLNYPALWERAREIKYSAGYTRPGPRDFVGSAPLSEPESKSVFDLSVDEGFALSVSLHTQGEVIYWRFENYEPPRSKDIAYRMARASGYSVEDVPTFSGYAGYKDWFILNYNLPSYTIEAGYGRNPIPISQYNEIYPKIEAILSVALEAVTDEQSNG